MRGLVGLCLAYWTRWTIFWLKKLYLYLNRFCRDGILGRDILKFKVQPKDFKPFTIRTSFDKWSTRQLSQGVLRRLTVQWPWRVLLCTGTEYCTDFLHTLQYERKFNKFHWKSNAWIEIFGKTLYEKRCRFTANTSGKHRWTGRWVGPKDFNSAILLLDFKRVVIWE